MSHIRCIIEADDSTGRASCPPVNLNGKSYPIALNTPITVPEGVYEILKNSTHKVSRLPDGEDPSPVQTVDDGGAAEGSGGSDGGADAFENDPSLEGFDADAVIVGTIEDVEKRLLELTPAQLDRVEKAEHDREVPRVGIQELIDKAKAAFDPPSPAPAPTPAPAPAKTRAPKATKAAKKAKAKKE